MENAFVVKANLGHQNVHSGNSTYKKDVKIITATDVYNDDLSLFGVVDALELHKDSKGVEIDGYKYSITIVEHKPTKPKDKEFHFDDALQVFAQKLCVDYVFKTNAKAVIYYRDVKQRVSLPFEEQYSDYLSEIDSVLQQMRENILSNKIPPIKKGQKCSGCSFKELCIPKINTRYNVKKDIYSVIEGEV